MLTTKLKDHYLPELTAVVTGRKKPSSVSVNLTDLCNQRCIYCEIGCGGSSSDQPRLRKEDMIHLIDQMKSAGIKRLSMCGGEPFLFTGITDLVSYAFQNKIRCNITSNGMIIHQLSHDQLQILADCQTQINISVDSFNPDVQSLTRGHQHALDKALKSIVRLQEYNVPVTVLTVISIHNYHELFNTFVSAYKAGIREVWFQPVIITSNYPEIPVLNNKHLLNPKPEDLKELNVQLDMIYRFEKRHAVRSNVYRIKPWINAYIESAYSEKPEFFHEKILKKFYCREVYAVIDINYYGGIQPCGLSQAETYITNNTDTDLLSLWKHSTQDLKKQLALGHLPQVCRGCCHKFGRNMLASVMRFPLANHKVLANVLFLLFSRTVSQVYNSFLRKAR